MGVNGDGLELEIHLLSQRVPRLCELFHRSAKSLALSTTGKSSVILVRRD